MIVWSWPRTRHADRASDARGSSDVRPAVPSGMQRVKDGRGTCDVSSLVGDTEVHKVQERIDVTLTHARYK
jgi:hypothetical protein